MSIDATLEQLKDRLTVYGNGQSRLQAWNDAIGNVDPKAFYDALSRDLPGTTKIHIESLHGGHGEMSLSVTHGRTPLIEITNKIARPQGQLFFDEWRVGDAGNRGRGLGSILLENHLDAMALCGLHKVELRAGREDGAYYWSRKGAYLKDDFYVQKFNQAAREVYERHRDTITPGTQTEIESLLNSNDPTVNTRMVRVAGMIGEDRLAALLVGGYNPVCVFDTKNPQQMQQVRDSLRQNDALRRDVAAHFPLPAAPGPTLAKTAPTLRF